jgi:aminodeoxyfutalosine synthase
MVGGCHPGLGLDYYQAVLSAIRSLRPDVVLKCFTPVEIEHFANLEGISPREVLLRLRQAGLDMMAGGGAEIFAPDVRRRICPEKISGQRWLEISGLAHSLGLKTNCTMLFGHLETIRDRLEHLDLLRTQQDESGGFVCFIPLPFQTQNNQLTGTTPLTGIEELKTIAVCRLMLDNIPSIKSYWVMLGLKQAQAALFFGANDLDGTVVEEKIGHMAGADSPQVLTRKELEDMIRGCGLIPQERNGLFSPVQGGRR